ncbi:MAG TPA: GNAT family N-acetyltransferase [Vicinamibacterales bacterium]|nr:GNAT family N-acetyltransferase [Vicinamibacterales bacterium]
MHSTSTRDIEIRPATDADASALVAVYNPYILETTITFEEQAIGPPDMASRVAEVDESGLPFLLAESAGIPVGFAYASRWKGRCAYRHSVETTVYVVRDHWRRGAGAALYAKLLEALGGAGIHTAIGGIALPNDSSIVFHERFGFTKVAHFREVGFKFNRWIDVGYWQLLFEHNAQ